MIEVEGLRYSYNPTSPALDGVSLKVQTGSISAILGESGSGKTTLLMCLARFLEPESGGIRLDGQELGEIPEVEFRGKLGVVFQDLNLFPHLTVLENLTLAPRKVRGETAAEAESRAERMLDRLSILELAARHPNEISGGQAQRVAIARALMLEPEYLLLDEPTAALDFSTTDDFGAWLLELREMTTFVVVTHDVAFANQVAAWGTILSQGKVTHSGELADLAGCLGGNEPETDTGQGRSWTR